MFELSLYLEQKAGVYEGLDEVENMRDSLQQPLSRFLLFSL